MLLPYDISNIVMQLARGANDALILYRHQPKKDCAGVSKRLRRRSRIPTRVNRCPRGSGVRIPSPAPNGFLTPKCFLQHLFEPIFCALVPELSICRYEIKRPNKENSGVRGNQARD